MKRKEIRGLYNRTTSATSPIFSPSDISDLILWLDPTDLSTITESGGFVSQWDDKSGVGNHVVQATGSEQPQTGVDTISGNNVILFDGTNDYLELNPFSVSPSITIIFVSHVFSSGLNNNDSIFSVNSTNDFQINASIGPTWRGRFNHSGLGLGAPLILSLDRADVNTVLTYILDSTGNSVFLRLNGGPADSDTYNGLLSVSQHLRLANSRNASNEIFCKLGEILIYNRVLSSSELFDAEQYLSEKWMLA